MQTVVYLNVYTRIYPQRRTHCKDPGRSPPLRASHLIRVFFQEGAVRGLGLRVWDVGSIFGDVRKPWGALGPRKLLVLGPSEGAFLNNFLLTGRPKARTPRADTNMRQNS